MDRIIESGALPALLSAFAATVERVQAGVVAVQGGSGSGAGIVWSSDGLIATCNHVAQDSRLTVTLASGEKREAEVVARDPEHDIALLRTSGAELTLLAQADLGSLRLGQLVIAVGHPLGLASAATSGMLSGLPDPARQDRRRFVQSNIRLLPGNSGGPLTNVEGEVLGINSMVTGPGLGLTVPVDLIAQLAQSLDATVPWLGIVAVPVELPERIRQATSGNASGLLITGVTERSPAGESGLLLGDVIVSAAGTSIERPEELRSVMQLAGVDHPVALTVLRGGEPHALSVRLAAQPAARAA
ncbi:MAG TPA: trypsin-like peptidase domain-containing protein [Thermomicrobiaceae bacterium]|nr:trypsin-like peptidase domain-containing protein [Thermomicrobiaceae bacterium]